MSAAHHGLRILVTGATGGIAQPLCVRLARDGAQLVVHARTLARARALADALGGAEALGADLASLAEVSALGRAAGTVDVVVHAAGVGFGAHRDRRETSADGFELRMAVNYLAPFVLDEALAPPRRGVVYVASAGQAPIDLGDLFLERAYDGVTAYRRSKLALIAHAFDVAAARPDVPAVALHPGTFLDTAMVRDAGIAPLGPASDGVDAIVEVLRRALRDGTTGVYFDETRPARPEAQALDPSFRARLRDATRVAVRRWL